MPSLPSKSSRRTGATPVTKLHEDDVWQRTLDLMGLELVGSSKDNATATTSSPTISSNMASPISAPESAPTPMQPEKKLTFLDLPSETQTEIFKYVTTSDLISLSLVSKHFREIAATQLYRHFHIIFPDDDDPSNDSPIDGLAGGLDTFVTSDYDYAQHLRVLILEALSGGDKGERAYRHYLYDMSCGKFLNTLLLLTLRKAVALETFRWDIRVELSRQVFKALHGIGALQHLQLRMQAGPSIYLPPPAIPASSVLHADGSFTPVSPSLHNNPPFFSSPPTMPNGTNSFSIGSSVSSKIHQNNVKSHLPTITQYPPTISGFGNLRTLAILDMDTLDYVSEIATCVQNSSSTLSTLKLSLSETLANKSRKPPPEVVHSDDEESEDEFGQIIPGPPPEASSSFDNNGGSKATKAAEEKKAQEAVLGRIFGLETSTGKGNKPTTTTTTKIESAPETKPDEDPKKEFMRNLAPVAAKLMATIQPGSDVTAEGKETLALIAKAAQLYILSAEGKKSDATDSSSEGSSTAKATPASSSAGQDDTTAESGLVETEKEQPGLFDEPETTSKSKKTETIDVGVANPDDIDIESPDGDEPAVDLEAPVTETGPRNDEDGEDKIGDSLKIDTAVSNDNKAASPSTESRLKKSSLFDATSSKSATAAMSEYVRKTRGLALKTLAIYLLPVKASVISKAIDLTVLQSVTLLNVGPQLQFWNMLSKENKTRPLPLHKIHTDNVTLPFLVCVAQLETVTELYLLERTQKARVESTAAKTTVTMEQIRKVALKKHAGTLKILVIRNESGSDWDLNAKTAVLLTRRSKLLEELAVSFGIKTMHTLLQNIAGLTSLRALHTIQFRTDDTCMWVMREFRKFAVDNVSHNPEMKLEYLALDNNVERLVRRVKNPSPSSSSTKKTDKKGKGKENKGNAQVLAELVMGSSGYENSLLLGGSGGNTSSNSQPWLEYQDDDSSDEEQDSSYNAKIGLKVESLEGLKFHDVSGVRIFEKEILGGRL